MLFKVFLIASLLQCVTSYRHFQLKIPNGDSVPHPCKPNYMWEGVGHILEQGSGYRNPFGLDFAAEGFKWTEALCRNDSDGDGLTNGQELGDPDCTWKENDVPPRTDGLSHPGICDPWDSPTCFAKEITHPIYKTQEDWMREMCKPDAFVCDGLNETGVRNVSIRLPPTPVPGKVTTYTCRIFDLEALIGPGDYHMIAVEPIIDNKDVLHHMVLFGCLDSVTAGSEAFECDMGAGPSCDQFIHNWNLGTLGNCFLDNNGIRLLGLHGYKRVALQVHWNNPQMKTNWTDSSGLLLTYTPNLRQYDAGILMTGADYFVLPAEQREVVVEGVCTSGCTRNLIQGEVFITMAWNHMHYAGSKMNIEVKRNGSHLAYLTNDAVYNYDTPQLYYFNEEPFQLLPGDEIITTCVFDTYKRDSLTYQGDSTSDEMCYGLFTYYPKQNMEGSYCLEAFNISFCDPSTFPDCPNLNYFWDQTYVQNHPMYKEMQTVCREYFPCTIHCLETIQKYRETDPCMTGPNWSYLQRRMLQTHETGKDFLARFASCKRELERAETTPCDDDGSDDNSNEDDDSGKKTGNGNGNASTQRQASLTLTFVLICFVVYLRLW